MFSWLVDLFTSKPCEHDWVRGYYIHNQEEANERKVTCAKCGATVTSLTSGTAQYSPGSNVDGFYDLWEIARKEKEGE